MKRWINIAFGLAVLLMLGICIYAYDLPYNTTPDPRGGWSDFTRQWSDDSSGQWLQLDGSKYAEGIDTVTVSKQLPGILPRDAVLYMRSNHNEVSCFIGDKELFCEGVCLDRTFGIDYTGIWTIIPISAADAGQIIELHIRKASENKGLLPTDLILANRNTLTNLLVRQTIIQILIAFSMIALAIGVFTAGFILKNPRRGMTNNAVFWLALFILFSGIWMLMDDNVPCLFAPNNDAFYFLSFYSFMLLPVPFVCFIGECIPKSRRMMLWLAGGFLAAFLLSVIAAIFFSKHLSLMLPMTHCLIIIGLAATLIYMVRDKDANGRIRLQELLWGFCFFIAAAAGALVCFYLGAIRVYAILFKLATLLFVITLSWGTVKRTIRGIERALGFEQLTQTIPCGICRLNCRDRFSIAFGNSSYYEMFGYNREEASALGFHAFDYILLPEDRVRLRQELTDRVSRRETGFEIEVRARHKSGALMHILTTSNYLPERGEIVSSLNDITARRKMEEQLRISEMEFRIAAEQSEKYIMRYEIKSGRLHVHRKAVQMFGIPETCEDTINSPLIERLIGQSSIEKFREFFVKIHRGDASGFAILQLYERAMSAYRWYHIDFTTVFDHYGAPEQAIISFYDITEQREKELAYERLRLDAAAVPQDQVTTFECNLTQDEIDNMTGHLIRDLVQGLRFDERTEEYLSLTYPADRPRLLQLMNRDNLKRSFQNGVYAHISEIRMRINDVYRWLLLSVQVVKYTDNDDLKAFVMIRDIHTQKVSELELIQRSETDGLTGIMNRAAFVSSIDTLIQKTSVERHTLVMMDVDHFKEVNDTLGHDTGDKVLRDVTSDLRKILREGDILGRLGGDEFAFCFVNISDEGVVLKLLERVRSLLNRELGSGLCQSVSMGAASFGSDVSDFTDVYKRADLALYQAKRAGRNRFALYTSSMA